MNEQLSSKIILEYGSYLNEINVLITSILDEFEKYDTLRVFVLFFVVAVVCILAISIIILHIQSLTKSIYKNGVYKERSSRKVSSSSSSSSNSSLSYSDEDENVDEDSSKELSHEDLLLNLEVPTPDAELEKELEKEFEMQALTQKSLDRDTNEIHSLSRELDEFDRKRKKENIDLDWDKTSKIKIDESIQVMPNISYQDEVKPLSGYVSLAIEMLSQGVDEFKVAQTLMHKSKNRYCEYDVLQMIDALNSFSVLCAKGSFKKFGVNEEEAVVGLMNSDVSQSLLLIEQLMDIKIDLASKTNNQKSKEELLIDTSNLANLFGTLAQLSDDELALGAFELSLEIHPENINSWSKIGNLYKKKNSNKKAMWAYKNVLALRENEEHKSSVANSQNMLSQYYYATGNSEEATEMYHQSKSFYDMIGINRHLDKHELEIVNNLEVNQNELVRAEVASRFIARNNRIA
ncbi:MAG: hypothetical protein R3Y43_00495 [Alphaproteobacteria bacterium]